MSKIHAFYSYISLLLPSLILGSRIYSSIIHTCNVSAKLQSLRVYFLASSVMNFNRDQEKRRRNLSHVALDIHLIHAHRGVQCASRWFKISLIESISPWMKAWSPHVTLTLAVSSYSVIRKNNMSVDTSVYGWSRCFMCYYFSLWHLFYFFIWFICLFLFLFSNNNFISFDSCDGLRYHFIY